MKTTPLLPKILAPLPPPPKPGGPAVSVPIEQCGEWRKRHGLKIVGCDHETWPPTILVIQEKQ